MMDCLGLLLFAYSTVALFILGSIILRRCNVVAHGQYSTGDMVKMKLFCSFLWPVAIYKSKLRINFK